jgi:ATP-dependent DNA helicase DinG
VSQALNAGGAYALEAGTGTGKTFGYLVPLLEYLRRRPTAAVVVATSTKSLQDQMQTGELPALLARGADGRRQGRYAAIKTAVLKGKNCYLCAVALEEAFDECFDAVPGQWAPALAWLYLGLRLRDTAGEIESIAQPVERLLGEALANLRLRVAAEQACRHEPQPDLRVCVFGLHRQRADSANLIITNHYKLLSLPAGLLERAAACVIDEADRFPDNLRGALSRRMQASELLRDVLVPLLGHEHPIAPTPWKGPRRPPRPLLEELRSRLGEITTHLYYHLPPAERPRSGPEEEAYELLAEAELQDLQGRAAVFEEVADTLAATPLVADARSTADAAWLAVQAAAAVLRQRRAIWVVREALAASEAPLMATAEALAVMGRRFQRDRQGCAELPFGIGQAHWQDEQNSAPLGQGYQPKNYLAALQAALSEVERPMGEAGYWLGRLATYWPECCALAVAAKEASAAELFATRPTDEPTPDEKLTARALRLFERYQGQLGVLSRLLLETPTRDFIPVLERQWPEADVLGWSLTRQPANLWPYLVTVDPEVPSQPLQLRPDETSEAFALRRQAARQRQAALLGDPVMPLYEQFRTVIFTSATLYVQGELTYLRRMLDQPQPFADTRRIEAVFDYANGEQVLAGVPAWLPRFTSGLTHRAQALDGWRTAQCQLLLPLLLAYEGRTLVLFTSYADLEYARNWLAPYLETHDIELLSQPSRGSSQWCIRRFRRVPHSVLLGVDRMWAGVDFPGHTLCQVVVWRAPMPSLSDPLASHRIRYAGKNAFWQHYGRPAARLKLRQGFGRLVRREKDKGGFVLLDARLTEHFYADLLQELPAECRPVVFTSPTELLQQVVSQILPLLGLKEQLKERGLADVAQLLNCC